MAKSSVLRDFLAFVRHEKKWWMIPLVLVLFAFGAVLVFSSASPLGPFLYSLF